MNYILKSTNVAYLFCVYVYLATFGDCRAQAAELLVTNTGNKMWVAGRDHTDVDAVTGGIGTHRNYVATVLHIYEDKSTADTDDVLADMWVYRSATSGTAGYFYDDKTKLTTDTAHLTGTVSAVHGSGHQKRQSVELSGTIGGKTITVWLTVCQERNGHKPNGTGNPRRLKRVLCRYKITPPAATKKKGCEDSGNQLRDEDKYTCDEVPTDDVLEEEVVDPDTNMDPAYVP